MVVYENSLVVFGLSSASNNELFPDKLIHGLNHSFPFHSGLYGDVVVAVPAVAKLYALGFAEKKVNQHLPWNKLSKDMPVHEEVTAILYKFV